MIIAECTKKYNDLESDFCSRRIYCTTVYVLKFSAKYQFSMMINV